MSVTRHKSYQSLMIYQKVKSDEKLMMGMSLTYSLLHSNQVQMIQKAPETQQELPHAQPSRAIEPQYSGPPPPTSPLQEISNALISVNTTHAQEEQLLPAAKSPDFDILDFLCDTENDDQELLMAATQYEKQQELVQMVSTTTTKAVISKKNSLQKNVPTFAGCSFGSIGTLNIHIHKN